MKIHFFTARNIEDYRKEYRHSAEAREYAKTTKAETKDDFDQEVFYNIMTKSFSIPKEALELRIWDETGIDGLRLDFNLGLRLDVPEGNFRVKISDADSGQIFFDKYISGGRLISVEQYYIRWQVDIFLNDGKIFSHTFNLERQNVVIMIKNFLLGDALACLPFLREFKRRYNCNLSVIVSNDALSKLIKHFCPDIPQIKKTNFNTYATYYLDMSITPFPLIDLRNNPMERIGGKILGINYTPPPVFFKPTAPPVTNELYVCIAVQASQNRKTWLYPGGWDVVINYLKSLGYRVFCIDKNAEETNDGYTVRKPEGAEDFTGNLSLMHRANMLHHAEFFIGLSSGLSWLANAVGCTVVMICGFSQDWFEFYTPYRVANRLVCNGCFNDIRVNAVHTCCPYHKGTERELECQKTISPRMVIDAIERLIIDKGLIPPALK